MLKSKSENAIVMKKTQIEKDTELIFSCLRKARLVIPTYELVWTEGMGRYGFENVALEIKSLEICYNLDLCTHEGRNAVKTRFNMPKCTPDQIKRWNEHEHPVKKE